MAMSQSASAASPAAASREAALRAGFARQSAGDLDGAEAAYRAVLTEAPEDPRALTLLAAVREAKGDRAGAEQGYRAALRAAPDAPAPRLKLAGLAFESDDVEAALGLIRPFTRRHPKEAQGWRLRGRAAMRTGGHAEAAEAWAAVEALGDVSAAGHLGKALQAQGDHAGAIAAYGRLLAVEDRDAAVHGALGSAHSAVGDRPAAIACFRRAIALDPAQWDAHAALGYELQALGRFEDAVAAYEIALPHAKTPADVLNNLGNCRLSQGRPRQAQAAYRAAVDHAPENGPARRNLCMATAYDDGRTSADLAAVCRAAVADLAVVPRPPIRPIAGRPLRVGFVSADFRAHSVAAFVEPLFAHADPAEIEVYAYSLVAKPDAITRRLAGLATAWREARGWSTAAAVAAIRADDVDVLVDLAGQTSEARFDIFAARPAPVQASWLGWPATTGFDAIDFKISDVLLTPRDTTEVLTERPLNLDGPALAFEPPNDAPAIAPAPILANGYPTFGSFNRIFKASPRTLGLWADVLAATPDARLFLKDGAFRCPAASAHFLDRLDRAGIAPERATLKASTATRADHLACYGAVDVALDSAPYNGVTTTCEALWMGVPTVTVAGDQALSRYGLTVLFHAGLADCVAEDGADYVDRAVALVARPDRLADRRRSMRHRLAGSPLLDGAGFARSFARGCREMARTVAAETT